LERPEEVPLYVDGIELGDELLDDKREARGKNEELARRDGQPEVLERAAAVVRIGSVAVAVVMVVVGIVVMATIGFVVVVMLVLFFALLVTVGRRPAEGEPVPMDASEGVVVVVPVMEVVKDRKDEDARNEDEKAEDPSLPGSA
jgi:uncharacterized membrane protein